MQVVQFNFSIEQRVQIKGTELTGFVTALLRDSDGHQYRVCYWDGTIRKVDWMFQHELKNVEA